MTEAFPLSQDTAQRHAETAVQRQFGLVAAPLTLLNPGQPPQASFVFRAGLGDQGSVIVKIADPARMAVQVARLLQVWPQMNEGRFRVPQVIAQDPELGLVMMEDARGQSAQSLWLTGAAGRARAVAAAGAWLARFHKPTAHIGAFNPDPHLHWLQKQAAAHRANDRIIPDFARFDAALARLHPACDAARGQPVLRSVTHRDYHPRNLLIRNLGRCYGIDFENARRDEALRDLLFFTADAAKIDPGPPTADRLRAIATALRAAYNRPLGAGISRQTFQAAFALSGWASLDGARAALGPNRARALSVMQLMAVTEDLFADP